MFRLAHYLLPAPLADFGSDVFHETYAGFLLALQEGRIKVICGSESLEANSPNDRMCHAYLSRSLWRRCRRLREDQPFASRSLADWWGKRLYSQEPGPVQNFRREELRTLVREAIDRLPPPMRDVVRLHDLFEIGRQDVANELGIPLGTVHSRLSRARALLADSLNGVLERL